MEHKKVNFLHSVRLKMLLAMAFFAFVTGGFACALFISSTKEEIGSVTRGYMRDLSRAYGVMLDNELDTDGDDALSGEHLASILAGVTGGRSRKQLHICSQRRWYDVVSSNCR